MLDPAAPVVVQGITGRQGAFWTERMQACGTDVVAGVTPGKGGRRVHGVPVYDSVAAAAEHHRIGASVLFVPPLAARAACLDALAAGVRLLVLLTEHIPGQDTMEILAAADDRGARVIGPNTAGVVVPGRCSLGIMPAFEQRIFRPGRVGVVSRSGSLGALVCLEVVRAGRGQAAFVGVGGDPIVGTTTREVVAAFDADPGVDTVVLVGEVGGAMEEDAAEHVAGMRKPVFALIAGRTSPPGRRMGHAGAIVSGGRGTAEAKVAALHEAGAVVLETPSELADRLSSSGGPTRVRFSMEERSTM
jgi:succinyl-CoA synthetase alpha subunit